MATAAVLSTALSFGKDLPECNVAWAEEMIARWDPNTGPDSPHGKATTIFALSQDEARRFLLAVYDIRNTMNNLADGHSGSAPLIHAERLMESAMRRLQKEFSEILSFKPNLQPSSSSSSDPSDPSDPSEAPEPSEPCESSSPTESTAATDNSSTFRNYLTESESDGEDSILNKKLDYLREVAECMISSGYAQECVEIYKHSRRSVVDDGLSRLLGSDYFGLSHHVHRLTWESIDSTVTQWILASSLVFPEIFAKEKDLSDFVFASSEFTKESCFAEVTGDAAVDFFKLPHEVASKHKRPQEKLWHYLNMYRAIKNLLPEIESNFSSKSTKMVRSQVDATLLKLASTITSMLSDFESALHKDHSKVLPPNGGLHPLTQWVTSHLVSLADYADIVAELLPYENGGAAARFVWLMTTLLCKLDVKSELYKDASQSYLFLANNIQYVVNKAEESQLGKVLGHEWLASTEAKARSFAKSFMRFSWTRVLESLEDDPSELPRVELRRERMVHFNVEFEKASESQASLVVLDAKVRKEIKSAIVTNIIGMYRSFYERYREELRAEVRFAPEDLVNRLSGLYGETSVCGPKWERSRSASSFWSGGSSKGGRWKWLKESRSFKGHHHHHHHHHH